MLAMADPAVEPAVDLPEAVGEAEPSTRGLPRGVTPETWEGIGLPPSPVASAPESMDAPVDPPPLRVYARRPRDPDLSRNLELEMGEQELPITAPIEERFREAQERLERANRENEMLMVMMRVNPPRGGADTTGVAGGHASTPGKGIQPREYSPRGGVGPAKWLFHMGMYFEYAHVADGDRVYHGAIFLRDAAEAWWRAHVLATTDDHGDPTAERITEWEIFRTRLTEVFTHTSEKEQARHKLYALQQTSSVQMYTMSFREISFAIDDLAPAEAKTLYEKGLKRDIWKDVRLRFPKTLEEVIAFAEQIDGVSTGGNTQVRPVAYTAGTPAGIAGRRYFARRGGARPQGARLNAVVAAHPPGPAPVAPPPGRQPMLAAFRPPPRRAAAVARPPAAPGHGMDRERLRRENRCFLCAQVGHLARDCPTQGNGPRRQG